MMNTNSHSQPLLGRLLGLVAMLSAHFFAMFVVTVELAHIVPTHILLFAETDVDLPVVTIRVMDLSYFFVRFWYLIIPLGMIADAAVLATLTFVATKKKWLVPIYSHLWLLAVILLLVYVNIAIALPTESATKAIKTIGGPPG